MKRYNIFGEVVEDNTTIDAGLKKFGDYSGFVEKFKGKHTTDDCYTPPAVYDAVVGFCRGQGWIDENTKIIRPFYPGEDFKSREYPEGCAVIDNPPFSIYAHIVRWFIANGVRFFLFGPGLTLKVRGADVCYLPLATSITYDNGAKVNTGFVTNMLPGVRVWTAPALVRALRDAQPEPAIMAKNTYPDTVLTPALVGKIAKREVDLRIMSDECHEVQQLASLKREGKSLFGGGWLLSERAAAERAAGTTITLTDEELAIISRLSK